MDDLCGHIYGYGRAGHVSSVSRQENLRWFVLRDLKRANTKLPAYKMLGDMGIEVFMPMVWKLVVKQGKRIPQKLPFIQNIVYVHESYETLAPIVESTNTLQYIFLRDGKRTPMTVRDADMERFITAVEAADNPDFYAPQDVKPSMVGKYVRIVGGPLDGYEGRLQKLQGSRVKRLFVELPGMLTVAVEVQPEFIQVLKR